VAVAARKRPSGEVAGNPSIKNPDVYEALRDQGASKEKAARISNAETRYGDTGPKAPSRKGGGSPKYEDWRRADLYAKAREIGIPGLSRASKTEIIDALRSH
jgi:hypothetical protein